MAIPVQCPSCQWQGESVGAAYGQTVQCGGCGIHFKAIVPEGVRAQCPKCQWETEIADGGYGGMIECEECGIRFVVRGSGETLGSKGQYGSLAIFAGVIMLIGMVQGIVVMVVAPGGLGVLMGMIAIVMGVFSGLLILTIRDIAINSRATRKMVEAMANEFGDK
jgi:hypothetical protein